MKKKETTRKFALSYDEVITKSQSIQPQYLADIAEFSAFDPSFTSEQGNELATKTNLALEDSSEASHSAAIQRKTEELDLLRTEAAAKYQRLLYFVHSAFGNNKAIDNTFGRSHYAKAVRAEKEMITLLTQACKAALLDQFKTGLAEKGMPDDLITSMQELATQLTTTDNEQEMLKKQQLLVTAERIKLYNSIWDILQKINAASKILYANDPERLAIYQLYDTRTSSETAATEDVS